VSNGNSNHPPDSVFRIRFEKDLNLSEHHSYLHIRTTDDWTSEHCDEATDKGTIFVSIVPYNTTGLDFGPATTSLNYGTTVWEGLKCYRLDNGKPVVFPLTDLYRLKGRTRAAAPVLILSAGLVEGASAMSPGWGGGSLVAAGLVEGVVETCQWQQDSAKPQNWACLPATGLVEGASSACCLATCGTP
jgi:hypothetical protein